MRSATGTVGGMAQKKGGQ